MYHGGFKGISDMFWNFLKWMIPPPPDLFWGKFEIGKILNFRNPSLRKKNITLKHLKLPKNHFKTNLFFVQLKHLKFSLFLKSSTFTFGKKLKIRTRGGEVKSVSGNLRIGP